MAVVKSIGKRLREGQGDFQPDDPGGKERPVGTATGVLDAKKDWPDKTTIQLDWREVSDIMREVKEKGVVHKDLRWGTTYIEREFKQKFKSKVSFLFVRTCFFLHHWRNLPSRINKTKGKD